MIHIGNIQIDIEAIITVWDFDKTLIPGYMLKRITLREQPLT